MLVSVFIGWLVSNSFILYNIYFHAGVTLDGMGHSVFSVYLPQDAVSKRAGSCLCILLSEINTSNLTCHYEGCNTIWKQCMP